MFLRRVTLYSLCVTLVVIVLFFMSNRQPTYSSKYYSTLERYRDIINLLRIQDAYNIPTTYDGSLDMDKILEKTRWQIKMQLNNYNFSSAGVRELNDLVIESNGQPIRNIIITTWRSGSTFLGEVLNAMPGTFYHYEPLGQFGNVQIRGPPQSTEALKVLKNMLKCNFEEVSEYFEFSKTSIHQLHHNFRLWDSYCKYKKDLCYDGEFTSQMCKVFPIQTMKVIRLRLRLIQELLEEMNIKVILLVRDPRGVLESRQHRGFCLTAPDCWRPDLVCADMVSDYVAAGRLMKQFPNRVIVQRYEELALEPNSTTQRLFKFLGMTPTLEVEEYIRAHTNVMVDGVSSTFKVSKNIPFKWKTALDYSYVHNIQSLCTEAMSLWGYRPVHNSSQMANEDFFPLQPYSVK